MHDDTRPIRSEDTAARADVPDPTPDLTTETRDGTTTPPLTDPGPAGEPSGPVRRRPWLRPAVAGLGLVVVGGLGGFGIGHATAGGDQLTPTSFRGGPDGGSAGGSAGGPGGGSGATSGHSGSRTGPPPSGTGTGATG